MAEQTRQQQGGWALILGASSGFGAAVALDMASRGYDVLGVHLDRRATLPEAERVRQGIEAHGRKALFFNVNAADPEKRRVVCDALAEQCQPGGLRLVLHSLAFGTLRPLVDRDPGRCVRPAQLAMTLDVMAGSFVFWVQEVVWRDLLGEGSQVLAMTSAGSSRAMAEYGPVAAAKAALEAYVRQLAVELGSAGVAVNALRAGVTDTPALRKIPGHEAMMATAKRVNPRGRLTLPEDVARFCGSLVEAGGSWVSGNVLGVDGGEDVAAG